MRNQIRIGEICIKPNANLPSSNPHDLEDSSFWEIGCFRMFISHLSSNKESASNLKTTLKKYGISCFVAHEDITPSLPWLAEIEKALNSMDALCAILNKRFKEGEWCDQEVGYALGKGVLRIPLSKNGQMPYGFMGKIQAIKIHRGENAQEVVQEVFKAICANHETRGKYMKLLSEQMLHINGVDEISLKLDIIERIDNLNQSDLAILHLYFSENALFYSDDILGRFNVLFDKCGMERKIHQLQQNISLVDDDLPF